MSTNDVLKHHLAAFGANDLDGIMEDYTEESELFTPSGPLKGLEEIRRFFSDFFQAIPVGSHFEMKQLIVSNQFAYIVWTSESDRFNFPLGTDTFFIQNQKISYHTVADYRISKF